MDSHTDPGDKTPDPTRPTSRPPATHPRLNRALSSEAIAIGAVLVVAVAVGSLWVLLAVFGGGSSADRVGLDAVRTASTIVLGTGGGIALYLAARRQRSTELDLLQKERDLEQKDRAQHHVEQVASDTQAHQLRIAEATERDAAAGRITELYTAAADQLGHAKAPVRLAGLYALERLAQDNPEQRQTIVNVLCAYLRMPFQPPGDAPADDANDELVATHRERVQEREVRLTAQGILIAHLRPGDLVQPVTTFWTDVDLDLTGATLIGLQLQDCRIASGKFDRATFTEYAWFEGATFTGDALFNRATFIGDARFIGATFTRVTMFTRAAFTGDAVFTLATFISDPWFFEATFNGDARFNRATFTDIARFNNATFTRNAEFTDAVFEREPLFDETRFERGVPAELQRHWPGAVRGTANEQHPKRGTQ